MMRAIVLAGSLMVAQGGASRPAPEPLRPPGTLEEAGEAARAAWQRRDLSAFVSAAQGGRLLVSLPAGQQSAPITPDQAEAILASYVQGTVEVTTVLEGATVVDSTRGYVQLARTYRLLGIPGERESVVLLGYRRGRGIWVLTEVRIAL